MHKIEILHPAKEIIKTKTEQTKKQKQKKNTPNFRAGFLLTSLLSLIQIHPWVIPINP